MAGAGHDVGVHHRGLAECDQGVVGEVALLDHAVHDVDLAKQRGAQAVDHAALHLLGHGVGVDHGAAVDGTHHAVHADLAFTQRDLGDLRHDGAKGFVQRDAPGTACGQGLAPARLVGGQLEHCGMARRRCQQGQAEGQGVLFCGGGQLVDEAFREEGVV